jgi:hypothetical protein
MKTFDEWYAKVQTRATHNRDACKSAWQAGYKAGKGEATPSQEPVAWLVKLNAQVDGRSVTDKLCVWHQEDAEKQFQKFLIQSVEPLYAHPSDAAAQIAGLKNCLDQLHEQITEQRRVMQMALQELKEANEFMDCERSCTPYDTVIAALRKCLEGK